MNNKTNEFESRIDTLLATLWGKRSECEREMDSHKSFVASLLLSREERRSGFVSIDTLRERAAQADGYNARQATEYLSKWDNARAAIQALDTGTAPVAAIFEARQWSRFFLVNNTNGHIHSSMQCSTCFQDTDFSWLPELSGLNEAQAVEAYGCILCSVCFPSAPVEWTNGVSKADQAAKDDRAAAKAEREAARAAKSIMNPDGSILLGKWGPINTLVTAQRELTDTLIEAERWNENIDHPNRARMLAEYSDAAERIIEAIAAKTGETIETVRAEANAKATKKRQKEGY